ncbi:PREDICTED: protein boule-like isoform X2 [Lepidothrix coronata]|uniref:Protein boule-like n=1 Tax=Lepidothrix coronata TaxID=321398 RepID=A0A6J0J7X5_9PASS|nr:PREDICTED: protein boule-like isoform X2 [Lepidothrix coronata]
MDPEGAVTDQMQTESLPPCPNTVSPVRLNNLISSPRFGTVTPNRVFVGGIDFKTNENDLKTFFAQYGSVREVKIINDRAGVSKGYGFVTFETQEEAQKILQDAKKLNYKDKKLNIGPAIRKQQLRSPNARSAVTPQAGTMYTTTAVSPEAGTMYLTTSSGYPYVYHNGVAYFHTSEVSPVQQPWPSRSVSSSPVMVAPPVYQSPTYHYQAPTQCFSSQWQWSVLQSPTSSPPLLYLQPSEVFYQPIGITQEGGCISPPLLMEAAVPEQLYSDHGVQTLHHQPYAQSHIAMPAAELKSRSVRRHFSHPSSVSLKPQYA